MAKPEMARQPEPNVDWSKTLKTNVDDAANKRRPRGRDVDFAVEQSQLKEQSEREQRAEFREYKRKEAARKNPEAAKQAAKNKEKNEIILKPIEPAKVIEAAVKQEEAKSKDKQEQKIEQQKVQEAAKEVESVIQDTTKEQIKAVDQAVVEKSLTPEQAQQVKAVINNPEVKKNIFSRAFGAVKEKATSIKDWVKDSPRLTSFITGTATGMAVRGTIKAGFIAAYGANLPWLAAAGATAGSLLEGGRSIWRESKSYQSKEIMNRFRNSDYLEKAAMLSKMEELYKTQKFDADPEGYEIIRSALVHARTEMQTELDKKDGKFADFAEKDKLQYILNLSQGIRGGIEKDNRGREARNLIRDIEKSLEWKHDFKNVFANKKAVVVKAALKGAAYGALGAAVGGAISHYLFDAGTTSTVHEVIQNKPSVADHFTQHLDHRGLTGGARDSLHQLIEEQRGIDPNFAQGITVEQLVYAEDTLAKEALHHGVHSGVVEYTWSHDQLVNALDKASALGTNGTLTNAGAEHIHHIIGQKPHFLSELTRQKMLDFTPKDFSVITQEIVSQSDNLVLTPEDYAAMIGALLLVAASEVASADDRRIAQQQIEKLQANLPKNNPYDNLDYHKFPGWTPQDRPIPKPNGSPDGRDRSKGPENKDIGPTEDEFAVKIAHYLNLKSEDPKIFELAIADLQAYANGKFNNIRADGFPDWKDSDFSKLIEKIKEAEKEKPKNQDEKFPKGPPPSPHDKSVENPKNKAEDDKELDKAKQADLEAGAEDERNGEVTPNSVNKKLWDAGLGNVEVNPWPKEKISNKQKEQVQHLTNLFISSAKVLKELKISNKIVLNFYPEGKRELDFEGADLVAGIPLNDKGYNKKSFESLVDRIIEAKISEKFAEFAKDYPFKITQITFANGKNIDNQIKASDQYKAVEKLQSNLNSIDPVELKRLTTGLKEITIGDYDFIGDSDIAVPLLIRDGRGFHYRSFKPKQLVGMLREFSKDRFALKPMDLKEQNQKYPNIYWDKKFKELSNVPDKNLVDGKERPESLHSQTESKEMLYDTINNEFKDGFPSNVTVVMSDRFQVAPGILYLDMSKYDQKYLSRQLHQGLRRADPDRLGRIPNAIKDRLERRSSSKPKKEQELSDQDKAIDESAGRVIDSLNDNAEYEQWVNDFRAKDFKVPESQNKKFDQHFEGMDMDKILDESETVLGLGSAKIIPGTMDRELKKYVKLKILDEVDGLIKNGGTGSFDRAKELRDKFFELDNIGKAVKKNKKSKS